MLAPGLALVSSISWGVGDFLGGVKSRALPALVVMAASQPFGLATLVIMAVVRGSGPPGWEVAWAPLAALLGTAGIFAFYRGMAAGAISVIVPIAALGSAIPVVWGVVQGDPVSFLQEIGFIAAIGGSVMTTVERGERPRLAAGTGWGVLAMLAFGAYFIPFHAAAHTDWLWPSLLFRVTSVTLVWTALLASGQRVQGIRPHLVALVAIGLLDTGGNVFFAAAASEHGLLSVVSVLASLYPVVTVLLARTVLGERVQFGQNVGVAATLAGVVLISAG
ncbi:MAG TPA: DMT family transporter [Gaiellaceae bacterium]|nr:DMT family transporter [Gaiellaceae bacterium]